MIWQWETVKNETLRQRDDFNFLIVNFICSSIPATPAYGTYISQLIQYSTTGVTSGARNVYPSGTPEFTPGLSRVRVVQSFVFSAVFCRSLFVPLSFFLVLSVFLRFANSYCPIGIFKLFYLGPLVVLLPKILKLFDFSIFWLRECLLNFISKTYHDN